MDATTFIQRLAALGLNVADVEETFTRSGGPGGQHVNKVSTAVTLRHRLNDILVTVQDSRSQLVNREIARERFITAIEEKRRSLHQAKIDAREKRRRQNRPRPRGLKERMLETKRRRAQVKQGRRASHAD